MRRNDTTTRKWNASRPSYDEAWSDEDVLESPYQASLSSKEPMRPPWESPTETDNDTQYTSHDDFENKPSRHSADFNQRQRIERDAPENPGRQVFTLEDKSFHTIENSQARSQSSDSILDHIINEVRPQLAPPLTGLAGAQNLQSSSASPHHSGINTTESQKQFRQKAEPTDPYTKPRERAVQPLGLGKPSEFLSTPELGIASSAGPQQPDSDLVSESSPGIPSYPNDFRNGLKSRALSDAILETMHEPKFQDLKSCSSEDLTLHSTKIVAERTPSILLATNHWAEKNRILKEQLERNRQNQDNSTEDPVRASAYDTQDEYQRPSATINPHNLPEPTERFLEEVAPIVSLNTLVEEDEGEQEAYSGTRLPDHRFDRSEEPSVSKSTVQAAIDDRVAKSYNESIAFQSSRPSHPEEVLPQSQSSNTRCSVNTNTRPASNTEKSSPPVQFIKQAGESSVNRSDEDKLDTSLEHTDADLILTADEESSLLRSLPGSSQVEEWTESKSESFDKELPPILRIEPSATVQAAPVIDTSDGIATSAQDGSYTPSLYSAVQTNLGTSSYEPVLPLLTQVQDIADTPRDQDYSTWRPLKTNPKNGLPPMPEATETSRFSTSTTRSLELLDSDDYRFDMRDSFNPAVLDTLGDDAHTQKLDPKVTAGKIIRDDLQRGIVNSSSTMTIQPPLRHARSSQSVAESCNDAPVTMESERLADELLLQLAHTRLQGSSSRASSEQLDDTTWATAQNSPDNRQSADVTINRPGSPPSILVSRQIQSEPIPTRSEEHRSARNVMVDSRHEAIEFEVPHSPRSKNTRLRSSSTGSKFLEVMSPMTSMEQQRVAPTTSFMNLSLQSTNFLQYKDIKNLPTASARTQEFCRRTVILQQSSSGLREYLSEIQAHLKSLGRELPMPVAHVEYKPSRSLIPDKFVPSDFSRTTARLGDKGKDAAKGLISKSTKGFKGLFHSNSRSISGSSQKSYISAPLEISGSNRTASMIGGPSLPVKNTAHYRNSFQVSHGSAENHSSYDEARGTALQRLASPLSQKSFISSSSPGREHQSPLSSPLPSPSRPTYTTAPSQPAQPQHVAPLPQSGGSPRISEQTVISHIQSYFPKISIQQIERALAACEFDEQKTIGYLVVNGKL